MLVPDSLWWRLVSWHPEPPTVKSQIGSPSCTRSKTFRRSAADNVVRPSPISGRGRVLLHPLDPLRSPLRRRDRRTEVIGLAHDQSVLELEDVDCLPGRAIRIREHGLRDAKVWSFMDPPDGGHRKSRMVLIDQAGVLFATRALAHLMPFLDEVVMPDVA